MQRLLDQLEPWCESNVPGLTPHSQVGSYPAGHVHIHNALYALTESGKNQFFAQQIYGFIYIISLVLTCAIYRFAGSTPNWLLLALPLSKRLHSIFALRLFNDCWSLIFVQAAIVAFQKGRDDLGMLLFRCVCSCQHELH
jgi:alpha-1,3-mannosyltransferase